MSPIIMSTLGRGISALLSCQLPSTSTATGGRILLSAYIISMPAVPVSSFVSKSMKCHVQGQRYHRATISPSCGSLPQVVRCFHQSSLHKSDRTERIEDKDNKSATWEFQVQNPYGMLSINTDKSVLINRIDVLQHPGGDFAAFHLLGRGNAKPRPGTELSVNYDEKMNTLSLLDKNRQSSSDERWVVEVPPYYDLTLEHTGVVNDTIQVKDLENQTISIRSVCDIHVHNLKSRDVTLETSEGEVRSTKVLQGNALVKTAKNKGFTADRLQGQQFNIQTEDGNVQCQDIYGNTSSFLSNSGKIILGNVTGECSVATQGDVDIGSMDGCLEAKVSSDGSVKAYLVRPTSVTIETDKGDVSVSFPSDVKCDLDLAAQCVSIPEDLNLQVEEAENQKKLKGSLNEGALLCRCPQKRAAFQFLCNPGLTL